MTFGRVKFTPWKRKLSRSCVLLLPAHPVSDVVLLVYGSYVMYSCASVDLLDFLMCYTGAARDTTRAAGTGTGARWPLRGRI